MQPIDDCFSTSPLLHRFATSTATTTTVGGKVAATYLGDARLFLDDFVIFSRLRGCSRWLRGGLEGGLALHDGDFGGFWRRSSAAAMIVRLVRRGCASRRRRATRRRSFSRPTRGWRHAKKSAGASVRFPRSDALCGCPRV